MRKVVLFIAASLDGYIATKDESLDWLFKVEGEGDNGISEFYDTVDTVLMGRKTYDWIVRHETGEFPYKSKECYVFTRFPIESTEYVTYINQDVASFTKQLKNKEGKNIWIVGGGDILQTFIKEKLVDEMIITVAPTVIGSGIPLFREGGDELELTLKGTRTFNQFVELHYAVSK